jgi:hypothetical protein
MPKMVFVEGLWHTGKSYFITRLKEEARNDDSVLIHDAPRRFLTVRHAMYLYYPLIFNQNQVFDRSPITTRAISDQRLGIYESNKLTEAYWSEFYNDWVNAMYSCRHSIVVLYFRPFNSGEVQVFSSIENYIQNYPKDYSLVNPIECTAKRLTQLHEVYMDLILGLKKKMKKKFQFYQVEFRDTNDALDILRYEGVLNPKPFLTEMDDPEMESAD